MGRILLHGDGLPDANPTWAYEAAGNRTDSVCDNLNRTTSIGGVLTTCDIRGNRTAMGGAAYGWDVLNRLTSFTQQGNTPETYTYRADGTRVYEGAGATSSSIYRYDGRMSFEDVDMTGSTIATTTD